MSTVLDEYKTFVTELKETSDEFFGACEEGAEGRGSKTKALQARKLSMKMADGLKQFRALSIKNDKSK